MRLLGWLWRRTPFAEVLRRRPDTPDSPADSLNHVSRAQSALDLARRELRILRFELESYRKNSGRR